MKKKTFIIGLILFFGNMSYFSIKAFGSNQQEKQIAELKQEMAQKNQEQVALEKTTNELKIKRDQVEKKHQEFLKRAEIMTKLGEECKKSRLDSDACQRYLDAQTSLMGDLLKELNSEDAADPFTVIPVLPIMLPR